MLRRIVCIASPSSAFSYYSHTVFLRSPRKTSFVVLWILIALPLFVLLAITAGYASTRAVQFYADQCKPALPNNGVCGRCRAVAHVHGRDARGRDDEFRWVKVLLLRQPHFFGSDLGRETRTVRFLCVLSRRSTLMARRLHHRVPNKQPRVIS